MPVRFEWNGAEVAERLRTRLSRNMAQATLHVKGEVQKSINRGNADGDDPSLPGEPPKKVTGRLFQSIATDVAQRGGSLIGRIGTNVEYAPRLELGFVGTDSRGRNVNQAPRPFLRPALKSSTAIITRILAQG